MGELEGIVDSYTIGGRRAPAFDATVHFASEADAAAFFKLVGAERKFSFWWPNPDGHSGSDATQEYAAGADS